MRRILLIVLGLAFISCIFTTQEGYGAIYKYVDTDGLVNFADDLQSIPAQYRSSAKIVSGGGEPGTLSGEQTGSARAASQAHVETASEISRLQEPVKAPFDPVKPSSFVRRATVSTIVVVSVLFLFTILRIIDRDEKKSIAVARIALLWGMTVYLLYAHVGDVLRFVGLMGDSVQSVKQASEEKGKKAAAAVKSVQLIMEQIRQEQGDNSSAEPSAGSERGK